MRALLAVLTALTLALLAAASAPADAAKPKRGFPLSSKLLWATVNICDTEGHPDGIGIRGSMPGSGFRDEIMWMRFTVQYRKPSDGKWHNVGATGTSEWIEAGKATFRRREAGSTFTIEPPPSGSYTLRGVVSFEWRRGGEVVRRARKSTTGGHRRAAQSEPKGFSAATCVLS